MDKSIIEKILAIVVPCYNEESVLYETTKKLVEVLDDLSIVISHDSFILYVNDGSKDQTWDIIQELHSQEKRVCGVNLAANAGHQNALMAGLTIVQDKADMIVTIDADLQDDVNAIKEMVANYIKGNDIVYGVRKNRSTDTWFKRNTALAFYSVMKKMGIKSVYNHADYRLMSRRAVKQLLMYSERNLFLRGLVPLIGYKTACVYYDRHERFAGESKYPFSKMISFAFDGITSFSTKPVHYIFIIGILFVLVALSIMLYSLYSYCMGNTIEGWTSVMMSIWFCMGCILLAIGVIGEYIGKIYYEVKGRPRFNIESVLID
ncbi:MAG: glycosyltransferase family 2 protein [Bacteroidaceae bacterium]|nr:glycosyltransferase family 2 protein [Bacteroidaceae bacterium]